MQDLRVTVWQAKNLFFPAAGIAVTAFIYLGDFQPDPNGVNPIIERARKVLFPIATAVAPTSRLSCFG